MKNTTSMHENHHAHGRKKMMHVFSSSFDGMVKGFLIFSSRCVCALSGAGAFSL